jgi:hypothetical protein
LHKLLNCNLNDYSGSMVFSIFKPPWMEKLHLLLIPLNPRS